MTYIKENELYINLDNLDTLTGEEIRLNIEEGLEMLGYVLANSVKDHLPVSHPALGIIFDKECTTVVTQDIPYNLTQDIPCNTESNPAGDLSLSSDLL